MKASENDRADRFIVALITLTAAWLRFQYIGQPSLWWDEFITVGSSLKPLGDMLSVLMHLGPSDIYVELFPPLTHVIAHALLSIGHNDVLMRLPSALAGVAMIPVSYVLCRKPLGRLSALMAAMLMAISVYHIHYSREVRPYALFMLENLLALHLLYACLTENRRKLLLAYGCVVAAMLYTSYMAATLIFAQAVFAGVFLVRSIINGSRREALALSWRLGLALACTGLAYLPWAPAQLNVYKHLHDPSFRVAFNLDFVSSTLKEFAAFPFRGDFPIGWVFAGVGTLGCVIALCQKRRDFVLLMLLWGFMPVAGIFLAKARMELSSRYIFSIYFLFIVFAAHALATAVNLLGDCFFSGKNQIFFARLTAAAVLCLCFSSPNLTSLSEYYSRETSHYKELADYLATHKNNQDSIVFFTPRQMKLIYDWYGRDLLSSFRQLSGNAYKRAVLLAPQASKAPGKIPLSVWRARIDEMDILGLGIARTPVRPMIPGPDGSYFYSDDFSGYAMLEDAFATANMVPSPVTKTLAAHDAGLPGWAVYRFQAPGGSHVGKASLTIGFSTFLLADIPTDGMVTVSIIPRGKSPVTLAKVTVGSFRRPNGALIAPNHEMKRFFTLSLDLSEVLAGANAFDLRLDYAKCNHAGDIMAENLRLEATLSGPPADPAALPRALLDQIPLAPWVPGQNLILSNAVHAFSLDGVTSQGAGSPADLLAYQHEHPGDKPVRILPYQDGTPAVALYDPALADPYLRLEPGHDRQVSADPPTQREVRAIKLRGGLDRPVLTLGAESLPLPVICPAPAELVVNPGGQAELTFSPLFTKDGLDFSAMTESDNLRRSEDEDCLTCAEDKPCSLTYAMRSEMPVTKIRITAYPRVFSDSGQHNILRTLVSSDGEPWRDVNQYRSTGSGRWEGWKIPQYTLVTLNKPAREIRIRFELSNQKAQLWSSPDAHMRFEVRLDASSIPVPIINSWPTPLSLSHAAGLDILLLDSPQPFLDRLRRTR